MTTRQAIEKSEELIEYLEEDIRGQCLAGSCDDECSFAGEQKCRARAELKQLIKCLNSEV